MGFLDNPLLATDVYKMGHMEQYVPGTDRVYSYLCARSDRYYKDLVFFGLQYYMMKYLQPVTHLQAEEFLDYRKRILGFSSTEITDKVMALADLKYWPLRIKAIPEGTVLPVKNALFTIESTLPEFYWAVGFVESMLLKVWYPCTVATNVYKYWQAVRRHLNATVEDDKINNYADFMVHDFGYRSDSSEESAAISGAAHLIMFKGSDTVQALSLLDTYYNAKSSDEATMLSVPASEHSVMCSYGMDNELQAYTRLLDLYPSGIVSIVSDTYDIYRVCTEYLTHLHDKIESRAGCVVIRPDSGNPPDIICGDPTAPEGSPQQLGVLRLLEQKFGSTVNSKGYKVLNPKIGLIYGDGMYFERYENTLLRMREMNFAASNLVVGIGGILRQGTRDTLGMALKATEVSVNGSARDIMKSPITDPGKKSHTGRLQVYRDHDNVICTRDQATLEQENNSLLKLVFENGKMIRSFSFDGVKYHFKNTRRIE